MMVFILIINGLIVTESVESNELKREAAEQTTEFLEEELALCEKKLVIKKSVFVARNLVHCYTNSNFNSAYTSTISYKNPRPILYRSLLL
jgi:hypothetical protein